MVQKAKILFPLSQIGAITDEQRYSILQSSRISGKYESKVDRESAFEQIMKQREASAKQAEEEKRQKEEEKARKEAQKEEEKRRKEEEKEKKRSSAKTKSIFATVIGTAVTYFAKTVATQLARNLTKKSKKK